MARKPQIGRALLEYIQNFRKSLEDLRGFTGLEVPRIPTYT